MLRPVSLLPALVAVAATVAPTVASADPAGHSPATTGRGPRADAAATARQAAAGPEQDDPLAVTIDTLTPSYLPAQGPVRVSGTVTNRTDDRWTAVNLYAFIADDPITHRPSSPRPPSSTRPSRSATGSPTPGTFDTVDVARAGRVASSSRSGSRAVRPRRRPSPGVYWFGVHALGDADEPRDDIADGRARTFLPLVPRGRSGRSTPRS